MPVALLLAVVATQAEPEDDLGDAVRDERHRGDPRDSGVMSRTSRFLMCAISCATTASSSSRPQIRSIPRGQDDARAVLVATGGEGIGSVVLDEWDLRPLDPGSDGDGDLFDPVEALPLGGVPSLRQRPARVVQSTLRAGVRGGESDHDPEESITAVSQGKKWR